MGRINAEVPNKILLGSARNSVRYGLRVHGRAPSASFPLIFLQFYVVLGTLDLTAFLDRNFRVSRRAILRV